MRQRTRRAPAHNPARVPRYPTLLESRTARVATVLVALAALTLGAGVGLTLRSHASGDPSGGGALDALLSRSHNVIVFSEFGVDSDKIWAANPSDPGDRVELGTAPHAAGYSIFPALSPDGAYVAYTALGSGAADSTASSTGQLSLLDVQSGSTRVLANDIDLRGAPVWSAKADAVVVRRANGSDAGASNELLRVELTGPSSGSGRSATTTIAAANAGLYAIDFSPDGALYYAALSASGTDLMRAPASGQGAAGAPQPVAHLSDGIARNCHLSPDGKQLAYLAQEPAGRATAFVAQVLNIDNGSVTAPLGADAGAQFNPIWDNTDAITVGHVSGDERAALKIPSGGPSAGSGQAATGSPLPAPASGFDVPLSWSPDGAWLVARAFEGASPADPGPSHVVAIDASGARHQLSPQSDVEVAGWLRPEALEGLTAP
jgi:hypothetical protein